MFFVTVVYRLGWLLVLLAVGMISPAVFALVSGDSTAATAFIASGLSTAFCGIGVILSLRGFSSDEGLPVTMAFLVVAWFCVPFFAALPLYAAGAFPVFQDAYFEAVSALTTTGATLLPMDAPISPPVAAWRAILQWLGGLGTLVMASVIFTVIFWQGVPLSNVPMRSADRATTMDRLSAALDLIWPIYLLMTVALFFLLWVGGLPVFAALCISLSTISTGGMLPGPAEWISVANPFILLVLAIGMAAAGLNVMLHWYGFRGRFSAYVKDVEAKHYVTFLMAAIVLTLLSVALADSLNTAAKGALSGLPSEYGEAAFAAISLVTTTGYAPSQSAAIAALPSPLILALIAVGGSALSTSGGLKVIRLVLFLKHGHRELARLAHPHGVSRVLYGKVKVEEGTLAKVGAVGMSVLVVFSGTVLALSFCGLEFDHAVAAAISSLSNCGPAMALAVDDPRGFLALSDPARIIASVAMILGRLEVLVALSVANPFMWRHA